MSSFGGSGATAPRRPHHKSKSGCTTCKKRRIKCDERRPCSNCVRRGDECSLQAMRVSPPWNASPAIHVFHQDGDSPQTGSDKETKDYDEILSISPPISCLTEDLTHYGFPQDVPNSLQPRMKRILQHFASSTIKTMVPIERKQEWTTWPAAIPKMSQDHPYVFDGILAVTALHLSQVLTTDRERKFHLILATGRLNTGLVHYRTALEKVTTQNAEALFTFSTATTMYIMVTSAIECKNLLGGIAGSDPTSTKVQDTTKELIAVVIKIVQCIRGVLVILVPTWIAIRDGFLSSMITREWWPDSIPIDPTAIEEGRKLQSLEGMWMKPGRGYDYYFDDLATALRLLRENFALVSRLTVNNNTADGNETERIMDSTAIMVWITRIPRSFTLLLQQGKVEAWAIMAHYAILPYRVNRINRVWWLEDLATNLLATAALVLGEEHQQWIEWPLREIGFKIGTTEDNITNTPMK